MHVNTDIDSPGDHGTDDTCDRCTGSGCPNLANTLTLTVQVKVHRISGPAVATTDILWSLQDAIAHIEEIGVKFSAYTIDHVDYRTDTAG